MSKITAVALLVFIVSLQALALPVYDDNKQCYSRDCPIGTVACKRLIKTSADGQSVDKTIECLDAQNLVLRNYHSSEENPYGPNTRYEHSSFSGVYIYSSGNPGNINVNVNNDINNDADKIEDFSR